MVLEHGGYGIGIVERPGRLLRHALADVTVEDDESRATFSGTCADAATVVALLGRMTGLGLEIASVRITRTPPEPAGPPRHLTRQGS